VEAKAESGSRKISFNAFYFRKWKRKAEVESGSSKRKQKAFCTFFLRFPPKYNISTCASLILLFSFRLCFALILSAYAFSIPLSASYASASAFRFCFPLPLTLSAYTFRFS
jgi:hypothetical protein